MKRRITDIIERWFIHEPALFAAVSTHALRENPDMECPLRVGQRRVEYNPEFIREMSDEGLEEALRNESLRILLKHPYERRPDLCSTQAMAIGSNLVIGDNYGSVRLNGIPKPSDYGLEKGQCYEWYSREIQRRMPPEDADPSPDGTSGGTADAQYATSPDLAGLWDEDTVTADLITKAVENCRNWGSLPGSVVETIKANARARIDWHKTLSGFRASVASSRKVLTRMRPSRRSGFDQMGFRRQNSTRVCVAVDVSGSISKEDLSYFFGIIANAFRAGAQTLDVVQFDCGIQKVQNIRSAVREFDAVGRGGTSFQEPVDYAFSEGYDGLVILTDGYAPEPCVPAGHTKILWVCTNQRSYDSNHEWMRRSGRVCTIQLH